MLGFCLALRQALRLCRAFACLGNLLQTIWILLPSRGRADPGMLGFCLAIRQALRLDEPLHALDSSRVGILLPSRGRADPGMLGFGLAIRQALRLDEPLHALDNFLVSSVKLLH